MFLINPFIYAASVSYLVDDYSPVVAYSVDKISSTATLCCRVRRASDNAEQDIGFSGNLMDVASVETFVGTGNQAYLVKVYNQGTGGSTYDISQSVASSQGRVGYGATPVIFTMRDLLSVWKPPLVMASTLASYKTAFITSKIVSFNNNNYQCFDEIAQNGMWFGGTSGGVNGLGAYDGTNIPSLTGEDLLQHLGYFNMRSSKIYIAKDGAAETDLGTFATSLAVSEIGGRAIATTTYSRSEWNEMILFNSDESANRTAIETNINNRFSIY